VIEFGDSAMDTTNRTWVLRFFLVVFFGLVSCSPKPKIRADNLAVGILADPRVYRMNDVLDLETRLKNIGVSSFYIFQDMCWDPKNHLNIHVLDLSGNEVTGHASVLQDCHLFSPIADDTSRFIEMEPGSFEGMADKFNIRELVPGPGEYDIVVRYHSGISQEWISRQGGTKLAALPIWTSEYPEIVSNRIRVVVKP
jgi:hypothetical protein